MDAHRIVFRTYWKALCAVPDSIRAARTRCGVSAAPSDRTCQRLRSIRPAPVSGIKASASSQITSALCHLRTLALGVVPAPVFKEPPRFAPEACGSRAGFHPHAPAADRCKGFATVSSLLAQCLAAATTRLNRSRPDRSASPRSTNTPRPKATAASPACPRPCWLSCRTRSAA